MAGAIVQAVKGTLTGVGGSFTALGSALPSSSTTGHTFIGVVRDYTPSMTDFTDSFSNTYTQVGSTVTIGGTALSVWMCVNGTGGASHTPSIKKTNGDFAAVTFFEVSGTATSSALDGTPGAGLDTGTPFNATVTTANANDFIITIGGSNGATTTINYTAGTGFTTDANATYTVGTDGLSMGVMTRSVSATGTYGGNFTQSNGSSSGVITFALKEIGGSPGNASGAGSSDTASAPTATAAQTSSVSLTLKTASGNFTQASKFWTRTSLQSAATDGGSGGISATPDVDGVVTLTGLTIAPGDGWVTMKETADDLNSHNYPVTFA